MKHLNKTLLTFLVLIYSMSSHAQQNDTLEIQRNRSGNIVFARFNQKTARKITDGPIFLKQIHKAPKDHEFRLSQDTIDELGVRHQRYRQYWKGIKLDNAEYLVHGSNGTISSINGEFSRISDLTSVSPGISEKAALAKALQYVGAKKYKWEDKALENLIKTIKNNETASYRPKGELVFSSYDERLKKEGYVLSWKFTISSLEPENEQLIYVNATSGEIIKNIPLICSVNIACTAQTMYSGTQNITGDSFAGGNRLRETRNTTAGNTANIVTLNIQSGSNYGGAVDFANTSTNFNSTNWSTYNQNKQALDVHWGMERVLDYWSTVHNRNGINGLGLAATSYVHYLDPNSGAGWPNNAQWDQTGLAMRFGDGDGVKFKPVVSLDVAAHELGHGINQFTAHLAAGASESGALNEGYSDIWGACVENWATTNKQTWLIGEEIFVTSSFNSIRNLQDPKSATAAEGKHPNTYLGQFWDTGMEPHNNSTVLSHWFYLVCQGGSGTNDISKAYNVSGIGIARARQIAFRALAFYLTANSGYTDARTQTINAARDLYCDNSNELKTVIDAWYAVGVGAAYNGTVPTIAGGANPLCSSSQFTIQSQPAGTTVTGWQSSNTSVATVNASGVATKVSSGNVSLTATLTGTGSCVTTVSRSVWSGAPAAPTNMFIDGSSCPEYYFDVYCATDQSISSYTWQYNLEPFGPINVYANRTCSSPRFTLTGTGNSYRVGVQGINVCGPGAFAVTIVTIPANCTGGGGHKFATSPNPASTTLSISAVESSSPFGASLLDGNGQVIKQRAIGAKEKTLELDIRDVKKGSYILHITQNGKTEAQHIVIE